MAAAEICNKQRRESDYVRWSATTPANLGRSKREQKARLLTWRLRPFVSIGSHSDGNETGKCGERVDDDRNVERIAAGYLRDEWRRDRTKPRHRRRGAKTDGSKCRWINLQSIAFACRLKSQAFACLWRID